MKRVIIVGCVVLGLVLLPSKRADAALWFVVKAALIKAIKAADLQIQRLQNKTIWLQNAQKSIENVLSKAKLGEIGDWVEKHREQYAVYFDELRKVKDAISSAQLVRDVIRKQIMLVDEYKRAFTLFRSDQHFNSGEISYMQEVYTGIINESVRNLDKIYLVINSFRTEMTDGKRLELIASAAESINGNLNDLRSFNAGNRVLSIQRARDESDIKRTKSYYGIP